MDREYLSYKFSGKPQVFWKARTMQYSKKKKSLFYIWKIYWKRKKIKKMPNLQ